MGHRLGIARREIETIAARLDSLSPLAVLGRGYSLTERALDGRLVRDAADLVVGEQLRTRFARGRAISRVEQIEN
jgi:exodeoxyribonuclease VII large subunit